MFSLTSSLHFSLYTLPTDMRKSFDGLCGIVQDKLNRNPMNGEVFVFINKARNKIKLLHWESGGFVLYYKRLEEGTIEVPLPPSKAQSFSIYWSELMLMIEGISLREVKKRKRFSLKNS